MDYFFPNIFRVYDENEVWHRLAPTPLNTIVEWRPIYLLKQTSKTTVFPDDKNLHQVSKTECNSVILVPNILVTNSEQYCTMEYHK